MWNFLIENLRQPAAELGLDGPSLFQQNTDWLAAETLQKATDCYLLTSTPEKNQKDLKTGVHAGKPSNVEPDNSCRLLSNRRWMLMILTQIKKTFLYTCPIILQD